MANSTDRKESSSSTTRIQAIYVSKHNGTKSLLMESKTTALLIPHKGLDGDRYALGQGTYSAKFMGEPGKNLTMVSREAIVQAMERTGMKAFGDDNDSLGQALRRNLVLEGISGEDLNNMVGHKVRIGNDGARVFVHRRTVPCLLREKSCQRPGLMNNLWGVCGVNCEVLEPTIGEKPNSNIVPIHVGDVVEIIPDTHDETRIDIGRKGPGFFVRPADRTKEEQERKVKPFTAALACLWDPEGFVRVHDAYLDVGVSFWSDEAYAVGLLVRTLRIPFLLTVGVAIISIVIAVVLGPDAGGFL